MADNGFKTSWKIKTCWRDDIVGQQGAVWTRVAKDRESWRALVEGYFLQWKDTAQNRIEYIEQMFESVCERNLCACTRVCV